MAKEKLEESTQKANPKCLLFSDLDREGIKNPYELAKAAEERVKAYNRARET